MRSTEPKLLIFSCSSVSTNLSIYFAHTGTLTYSTLGKYNLYNTLGKVDIFWLKLIYYSETFSAKHVNLDKNKVSCFLEKKTWKSVSSDTKNAQRVRNFNRRTKARINKETNEKLNFIAQNQDKHLPENAQTELYQKEAENLQFWMVHSSWNYCKKCKVLVEQKLMLNYCKRPLLKQVKQCNCSQNRYITPSIKEIPKELRNLSMEQIYALRPFDVHLGETKRSHNGYRQKTAMFRVSWSDKPVNEKILDLLPSEQRKARKAYDWLMNSTRNKYKHFVNLRAHQMSIGKQFNLYNYTERCGIKTALWPHLYPFDTWCETNLKGNETRLSTKVG